MAASTPPPASTAPTASPSVPAQPTVTDRPSCPNPSGGACLGPLAAGTYATIIFRPQITYIVPAGWGNYEDLPGNFLLIPPDGSLAGVDAGTSDYLGIYASVALEGPCKPPAPSVTGPAAMAAFIRKQAEYAATAPRAVSVGGLSGVVLDIRLARTWKTDCLQIGGGPNAYLIVGLPPSGLEHGIGGKIAMRLYLLTHGGGVLAIEVDDISGGSHLSRFDAVIKSLQFGPG